MMNNPMDFWLRKNWRHRINKNYSVKSLCILNGQIFFFYIQGDYTLYLQTSTLLFYMQNLVVVWSIKNLRMTRHLQEERHLQCTPYLYHSTKDTVDGQKCIRLKSPQHTSALDISLLSLWSLSLLKHSDQC